MIITTSTSIIIILVLILYLTPRDAPQTCVQQHAP